MRATGAVAERASGGRKHAVTRSAGVTQITDRFYCIFYLDNHLGARYVFRQCACHTVSTDWASLCLNS